MPVKDCPAFFCQDKPALVFSDETGITRYDSYKVEIEIVGLFQQLVWSAFGTEGIGAVDDY